MPWRLILFIVIFAILLTFVTLNLENQCSINFGFAKFEGVPIFLTVFITFSLGLLCAMPLAFHLRKKKEMPRRDKSQADNYTPSAPSESETNDRIKHDAASARERFFLKRRGGKK